jgi:hypothetical protein
MKSKDFHEIFNQQIEIEIICMKQQKKSVLLYNMSDGKKAKIS